MQRLSLIILLLALGAGLHAQSPHGDELTLECSDCHTTKGWKLEPGTYSFNHNNTQFPLVGMHVDVDCKLCHTSLVFSKAEPDCVSCHTDLHQETLGDDCARCHTPHSWIVNNITEIHQMSRFPLLGAHITADCYQCHPSASLLNFEPRGVECVDCHEADYMATTNPNHVQSGFSTDCKECHYLNAFDWSGSDFNHSFFPLTEGHAINDCFKCHDNGNYTNTPTDCYSCHQQDYEATEQPSHIAAEFPTACDECHTLSPGWEPALYVQHDAQYFPIYSGKHDNTWISCYDCHTNPSDYASFTCIDCHEHNQPEMDDEHDDIGGYIYESMACFECHPTGDAENGFNHSATNFPLTGAHVETACNECHTDGYQGTTTICYDCHTQEYNESTNPNHGQIGVPTECEDCHTTEPGWIPATFGIHNEYYTLTGAHLGGEVTCYDCHQGNYTATPNVCAGCHTPDYNQSTNPNHIELGIATTCEDCHTTDPGWTPADFTVHNEFYPLTGAHATMPSCYDCHEGSYTNTANTCAGCHTPDYEQTTNPDHAELGIAMTCDECHTTEPGWTPADFEVHNEYYPLTGAHASMPSCFDCHQGSYTNTPNTCAGCHTPDYEQTTNPDHGELGIAMTCEDCHTTNPGWTPADFEVHNEYYPLTGAHATMPSCFDCHQGSYTNTPNTCAGCHTPDYEQTTNPDHENLGLITDCEYCHTTNPDWKPATFPVHNDYYALIGAHAAIANNCFECHEGNYNNTPNTCYGCHADDYNQATDPPHLSAQFPTDCELCHTQNAWEPSTFNHDAQYFPIYSGEHEGEWDQCSDCHQNPSNYSEFTCLTCHSQPDMDDEHEDVPGYQYNSIACLNCHPDGNGGKSLLRQGKIRR
ncbi:MAG: hypothetical protein JW731_10175 [Bacteroidales bacterium]|nr:hypothetical protein [Bacteroidales bacterium]